MTKNRVGHKVFVYGYRQMNLGDDLFFYILFSRYSDVQFFMCAPKEYREIYKDFNNVTIYPENKLLLAVNRVLSNLCGGRNLRTFLSRGCDAGVLIMGSCFGENVGGKTSYNYEPNIETVKNVFVIGVNVAQVFTKEHLIKVQEYFAKCKDVCFRDERSRKFFAELNNVRMAPDVVFQLGKEAVNVPQKKKVLFSLIDMSLRKELLRFSDEYEKLIDRLLDYFWAEGYEIVAMSFCKGEKDDEFIGRLMGKYASSNGELEYYSYQGNIKEALGKIQECEIVVGTRFHSMILAWIYGKKVLPIVYNDKMQNVINDYEYKGSYINLEDMKDFREKEIIKWIEEEVYDASWCIKESEKQFLGLDEYIYENK
ncbi:polysaccharide pyruvyl transferase family protein [Clostridium sp. SL.3.18]|jgi:colanic acid/amylovoran biosynthesis protein|nr:polysaccharide pyruvyl transferase family protein [Clostridium sp. SL.3.18]